MQLSFLTQTVHEMSGYYLRLDGCRCPVAVWKSAKNCWRSMNVFVLQQDLGGCHPVIRCNVTLKISYALGLVYRYVACCSEQAVNVIFRLGFSLTRICDLCWGSGGVKGGFGSVVLGSEVEFGE